MCVRESECVFVSKSEGFHMAIQSEHNTKKKSFHSQESMKGNAVPVPASVPVSGCAGQPGVSLQAGQHWRSAAL